MRSSGLEASIKSKPLEWQMLSSRLMSVAAWNSVKNWVRGVFVEKYNGFRHNTENDSYSGLDATLKNGLPLVAVINTDLLNWDSKASHPWIAIMEIKYDGKNSLQKL